MEQGHYVSIEKNGSGFEKVTPKTERIDEDWRCERNYSNNCYCQTSKNIANEIPLRCSLIYWHFVTLEFPTRWSIVKI